ncbi:nucleotidyltransferase [Granulicatella adiacens]|uniref:nucleotidyltransferase n=1 Tax=Granulicatella adiacens TaxID=46124 RepID=UPI0021A90E05|nr:nucleotidyltransferase [Granulicatella adiacens]MCT2161332.1 nucleotidyltransferase [Granulicatella adiacens]
MKICGVIAEFNPFHQGHAYLLEQARKKTSADVIVVVMSGNWVQRGEPAIEQKWSRAEVALQNGADVVIEMPTAVSCQSTDRFAKGAVEILQKVGCHYLAFGCEGGDVAFFETAVSQRNAVEKEISSFVEQNRSLTFASQLTQLAVKEFGKKSALAQALQSPNQQLGLAYAVYNSEAEIPMQLVPITRVGSGHLDDTLEEATFASGTALRKALKENHQEKVLVEQLSYVCFDIEEYKNDWSSYWPILKSIVLRSTDEKLRAIYQMEEGIENRLKEAVRTTSTIEECLQQLKNKRWSWARLQRLLVYVLLGITKTEMEDYWNTPIHQGKVLGFTLKGQKWLKNMREVESFNLITNYAAYKDERQESWDLLYDFWNPSKQISATVFKPIQVNKEIEF